MRHVNRLNLLSRRCGTEDPDTAHGMGKNVLAYNFEHWLTQRGLRMPRRWSKLSSAQLSSLFLTAQIYSSRCYIQWTCDVRAALHVTRLLCSPLGGGSR